MILTTAMQTALAKSTVQPYWFVWFKARNRITGEYQQDGLWTGVEPFAVSVDGATRTYSGAGGLLSIDGITYAAGTNIQSQSIRLTVLDPQVFTIIRTYEPKYAPVQIHLGLVDPATEALVGLVKVFDGFIDEIKETESLDGSYCEVGLVSSMRNGSRPLYLKQSDHYQRLRLASDSGRQYASIAGQVTLYWGRKSDHDTSGSTTATGISHVFRNNGDN